MPREIWSARLYELHKAQLPYAMIAEELGLSEATVLHILGVTFRVPKPKREWPDGRERKLDGSHIVYNNRANGPTVLPVNEIPSEVRRIQKAGMNEQMITLHHHADPEVEVYVDPIEIIAIDARWTVLEDE